jgi:hypothetical protein
MNAYFVQTENGANLGYLIETTSAKEFTTHRSLNRSKELEIHISPINEYTIESNSLPDIDRLNNYLKSNEIGKHRKLLIETWKRFDNLPGEFFTRVHRPILNLVNLRMSFGPPGFYNMLELLTDERLDNLQGKLIIDNQNLEKNAIVSFNQASILIRQLNRLFEYVYPDTQNLDTFSNEIRNTLILACTEFESQIKGVLVENSISANSRYFNTSDYVKLKDVLHLDAFEISINNFPELKDLNPFKGWDATNPTGSLNWYDNYNKTKHDRESQFFAASLINCVNAVLANIVMLAAQYGITGTLWNSEITNFLSFSKKPTYLLEEYYIPNFQGHKWKKKNLIV